MRVLTVAFTATLLAAPLPAQETIAFTNVHVIPMDNERIVTGQTVLVRNGRIVAMGGGGRIEVPGGATVVDGTGKYLMPGLAEMHAHVPSPNQEQWAYDVLFLYAANGVTTARGMLGHPWHLEVRRRLAEGDVPGPHLWTSGPSVNGNSVATPDSAVRTPSYQERAGYDFMKIHPGLGREAFDSLDAAADRIGFGFAGHVPAAVGVMRALEAGYRSIDHLDGYVEWLAGRMPGNMQGTGRFGASVAMDADAAKIDEIARRTREAGVWNVPTQTLMDWYATAESADAMGQRPELAYIPATMRQNWINAKRNWAQNAPPRETLDRFIAVRHQLIKALHDAGAGLLLGSDAPQIFNVPGFATHRELESIVAAGLTPYQALRTGTVNVAQYFGIERDAGTIAVGKRGDVILLNANPLADIRNSKDIAGVLVRGRWLPRAELDGRLAEIAERYGRVSGER